MPEQPLKSSRLSIQTSLATGKSKSAVAPKLIDPKEEDFGQVPAHWLSCIKHLL